MRTKIILKKDCKKSALCDRNEYFKLYSEVDNHECFKRMQKKPPLVINIDGSYYYYDKLVPAFGCTSYDDYRRELLDPCSKELPPIFIWR